MMEIGIFLPIAKGGYETVRNGVSWITISAI